ncbi:MAG: DUF4426 domain-containing protein [Luteimonas sp.]|nr:DUF4426 domain-containing protein [Luteimonas sp.]
MTEAPRAPFALAAILFAAAVLAGCGADPASRADLAAHAEAARRPAELQVGDVRIHASLAPASRLSVDVAGRYGVKPDRNTQLLLVGVRRGPVHDETSLPARVTVRVRDLRGVRQDVPMHETRVDGFIDYVGSIRVAPPDTLAFEVSVQREGAEAPDVLRFSREVFPPQ